MIWRKICKIQNTEKKLWKRNASVLFSCTQLQFDEEKYKNSKHEKIVKLMWLRIYSFDLTRKIKIICVHRRFLNFWKIAKENEILLFLWSFFFHYDSIIFWCFFSFTRARSLFDDNMILHSIGESSITATAVGKQLLFGNIGSANSFFGTGWTWTWAAIVTGNT